VFKRLARADNYPEILARFEADRTILKKIESPELFYAAGKAYLQARLYRQAAGVLGIAHDLYLSGRRPAELDFELGAALQAAGKPGKALPFLEAFLNKSPDAPHAAEASYRRGQILTADKAYGEALACFQTAISRGERPHDKGLALMGMAEAYRGLNQLQSARRSLIKAINHLATSPDKAYEALFTAYRRLGETYLELQTFDRAADALAMALKFTDQPQKYPDLRFLLGETYQKSAAPEQARLAFREVVAAGDSFWARLAEEALHRLAIEGKQLETPGDDRNRKGGGALNGSEGKNEKPV
jgi:tetratricopeptide (TPR) repeat protein